MRTDESTVARLLGALGLCAKARKLITGTALICEALRNERTRPCLVLAASDNSENTAKRLADRCTYYGVRLTVLAVDGDTLSSALGKSGRVAAVALTDPNLCRLVENTLKSI